MPLSEKKLIRQIRHSVLNARSVVTGIGDDCAVLRVPPGHELLVTTDFSIENVHFRRDWHSPELVGRRCLTRGLSDIAAMGGEPLAAFLSLAVANDVHEFIRAHETVLSYDFDVIVCGHLTRPGTRDDVEVQSEYVQNLRDASKSALATVKIEDVGARTGFDNLWALMDGYLNDMIEMATKTVLTIPTSDGRLSTERLGGADVWTKHHLFSMIQALRVENPD